MIYLQETTKWTSRTGADTTNHIYITDNSKGKMLGYIRHGEKEAKMFKSPIQWDTRGRTFVVIKREQIAEENVTVVEGSKGAKYFVTKTDAGTTCSCPGFKFRGGCKHIEAGGVM